MTQVAKNLSADTRANLAAEVAASLVETPFGRGFAKASVQGSQMFDPGEPRMIGPNYWRKGKEP